jgi:hypothetical protein
VVPLFVLDDAILSRADGLGVAFMLGSLRALREWYRSHGSDVVIRHGDPTDLLCRIAEAVGADRVTWNGDHSRLARERDRAVRRSLTRAGIDHTSVPNVPPRGEGTQRVSEPAAYLADIEALGVATEPVPRLADLGDGAYGSAPLTAGTDIARKRLAALARGTTYRRSDDRRSRRRLGRDRTAVDRR